MVPGQVGGQGRQRLHLHQHHAWRQREHAAFALQLDGALGLIIVPLGYADPILFRADTPYGASTVSGQQDAPPSADDLKVARFQGHRVTQVAAAIKGAGLSATKA